MTLEQIDLIAGWTGLVLTLMVFSYLLADNFLYRIAVHVLIGAAAAYTAIAAVEEIVIPWVEATITEPDDGSTALTVIGAVPLILGLLLFLKSNGLLVWLGNLSTALIIGVGTGIALVGVVFGTLFPVVEAAGHASDDENTLNAVILLVGTISTLLYFQYVNLRTRDGEVRRPLPLHLVALVGQGFIAITLGALYAGAIVTSLTIFSTVLGDQVRFLLEQLGG